MTKIQNTTRIILLLSFVVPLILIFIPFLTPIILAVFVSFALETIFIKLMSRGYRKKYFGLSLIVFLIFFIILPLSLLFIRIVNLLKSISNESIQNSQFFQAIFNLWERIQISVVSIADSFGLDPSMIFTKENLFQKVNPVLIDNVRLFLAKLPAFGLALFVFFSFLGIFTTRSESIKRLILKSNILPKEEIENIIQLLKSSCYLILVSTLLIGGLQALIVSVGSLVFGYHEFLLIFIVTFVLSFIPVIGAAPIAILLAIISFINGDFGKGIGMLSVALVAGSIDNILKPYIFSAESKNLHPLLSLFGIFGAIMVFGLPGLLLGPLIMQVSFQLGPPLIRRLLS